MINNRAAHTYLQCSYESQSLIELFINSNNYNAAAFQTQQCIEKTLKSLIFCIVENVPYPLIHTNNLNNLYEFIYDIIGENDSFLPYDIISYSSIINEWYYKSRYPLPDNTNWRPNDVEKQYIENLSYLLPKWLKNIESIINSE